MDQWISAKLSVWPIWWLDWQKASFIRRQKSANIKISASVYVAESSRDIRLRTVQNINILQENATEDTKRKKALTTVTNPNDLKGAVAHPISYDQNKQWTHTLYKKRRSENTPKRSFRSVSFIDLFKNRRQNIHLQKRSMKTPSAAQTKNCLIKCTHNKQNPKKFESG